MVGAESVRSIKQKFSDLNNSIPPFELMSNEIWFNYFLLVLFDAACHENFSTVQLISSNFIGIWFVTPVYVIFLFYTHCKWRNERENVKKGEACIILVSNMYCYSYRYFSIFYMKNIHEDIKYHLHIMLSFKYNNSKLWSFSSSSQFSTENS